jgi:cell wall-associated NlpC family hydrolase
MSINAAAVAYVAVGGLILYSGIKGATLAATAKAVLSGNLTLADTEVIGTPSITQGTATAASSGVSGSAILSDAEKYGGHKYVYGGPSNPTSGWDCSSFVSYVLGHDMNLPIPGGTWATATNNGDSHGPVASDYESWSGATTVPAASVQAGDLLCWSTHVGFAVDATHMFSAFDSAQGTLETSWSGPTGEGAPKVRSINATAVTGGGSSNSATANQAIAKTLIQSNSSYAGWDTGQTWSDLVSLWDKESGWSATAKNSKSGAYGIPQALPPTKMPSSAQAPTSDPTAQMEWGLSYIKGQYGSPVMAWAHEQANDWY